MMHVTARVIPIHARKVIRVGAQVRGSEVCMLLLQTDDFFGISEKKVKESRSKSVDVWVGEVDRQAMKNVALHRQVARLFTLPQICGACSIHNTMQHRVQLTKQYSYSLLLPRRCKDAL